LTFKLVQSVLVALIFASAAFGQNPVASFTVDQSTGCVPMTVNFTNTSQNAVSWHWDFGNGNFSTSQHPSNVFISAGNYTVKLTAFNASGISDTVIMSNVIQASNPPTVNFSTSIVSQCLGSGPISFTNQSSGYDAVLWDFGDGNTSTAFNPVHQYYAPGVYTITLVAYNTALGCTTSLSKQSHITVLSSPSTSFTSSHSSICDLQTPISFTPQQSSAITWAWDFGDGTTSTQQSPIHQYAAPGIYDVTLITTNQLGCSDTTVMSSFIEVLHNPVPEINSSAPLTGCMIISTNFSTNVSNATSWLWDFGDSTYSMQPATFHSYMNAGSFITKLTVVYANGCSNSDTVHVNNLPISQALYAMTPHTGCAPLTVQFINNTPGTGNTYTWTFGDGTTSNAFSPQHTYTNIGQYTTRLNVVNAYGCSTQYIFPVSVNVILPNAQFTADDLSGCPPHQVNFTFAGTGVYNYSWDFGDGGTSNLQSPSYVYNTPGNYPVTLTITDPNGCSNSYTYPNQVQITQGVNNFNAPTPVEACAPFTVNMNDNSPGAVSWFWDFDDGSTSTQHNPTHTYTTAGTYHVSMQTVSGGSGCSQSVTPYAIYIINGGEADFTLTHTVCPPYTATFTDQSTNAVAWLWDFGDGSSSTQQHPVHVYNAPGNYNVSLTITTADGCVYTKYHNFAVSFLPLTANATATSPDSTLPATVTFNANSTGATQWFWDFGDGGTSTLQNPVHIFTTPGPYNISLTISNPGCSFTYYYNSVTLGSGGVIPPTNNDSTPPPPPVYSCVPYQMSFSDPVQSAVSWLWDFGDGNTSTQQNPIHIYTDPGVFYVSLITWDAAGNSDTIEQATPFYLTGATADFTITQTNNCQGSSLQTHNQSVNAISYLWDFGDGTTSTQFEPNHSYTVNGINYIISLTVTDSLGCTDFYSMSYYSPAVLPISASSRRGCAGDSIQFNSGGWSYSSYFWDFGDGNNSILPNPVHAYADSGSYQVTLTVTDANGCVNSWQLPYLINISKPVAFFTFTHTNPGCGSPLYQFNNLSTGAATYLWNFGNNQYSTQFNPVKNFGAFGYHTISLTATDEGCSSTYTIPNAIYTPALSADFTYQQLSDCYPLTVVYADSSNDAVAWFWDFGDGTTSTLQNPTHTFTSKPFGPVTLQVTSSVGCIKTKSKPNVTALDFNIALSDSVGCAPFLFSISDSSTNVAAYLWNFGDGTTSTDPSPSHLFNNIGTYQVSLTAVSPTGCQQVITPLTSIEVRGPVAQFTQTSVVSCAPTIVNFIDSSSGATSWNWDFGNGNHSVLENPTHVYNIPGTYDVTLVVSDSTGCSDTLIRPQLVHITGSIADFEVQSTSGCSPWTVQFADSSISAFNWLWNFGDGNISSQQHPVHVYQTPGTYQVTLITQDTTGCTSVYTSPVPFSVQQPPSASFIVQNSNGCAPFPVSFTNTSNGSVDYIWYFGDGDSSLISDPVHTYNTPGLYTVSLVAINSSGCRDTVISSTPISIDLAPQAAFTLSGNQGCSPLPVSFVDSSYGANPGTIYHWDFGDGTSSSLQNPVHIYQNPGNYSVSLTLINGGICSDTAVIINAVTVSDGSPPVPVSLKSVSVSADNVIDITWGNLATPDLQAYQLYRYNPSTTVYDLIYTDTNPSNTSMNVTSAYTDVNVSTADSTWTYVVQAVNECMASTPINQLIPHTSINLKVNVAGGIPVLNWNLYDGCSVDNYEVYRLDQPSGSFVYIGTVSNTSNNYADSTVYCDMNVRYVIRATNLCGEGFESWSDEESVSVPGSLAFQKVDMVRSTVIDDSYVLTEWAPPSLAPALITGFVLSRSTDNINFTVIDTLPPGVTSYSDYDVKVHEQFYLYRIDVHNICGIESDQGLPSSSVLLIGGFNGQGKTLLRWSPYKKWDTGVDYYVVEKLDEFGQWQTVRIVNGDVLELVDP
jgi:PKD repeat protein